MDVILIYQTDAWHGTQSRELVGIASTKNKAKRLAKEFIMQYYHKLSKTDISEALIELMEKDQTMCLSEKYDFEMEFETIELNQLL